MYWLGHADRSMSDRYDKVGEGANAVFRAKQAAKMGVGFVLPKELSRAQNSSQRRRAHEAP